MKPKSLWNMKSDWKHWRNMDFWTEHQAALLLHGFDPLHCKTFLQASRDGDKETVYITVEDRDMVNRKNTSEEDLSRITASIAYWLGLILVAAKHSLFEGAYGTKVTDPDGGDDNYHLPPKGVVAWAASKDFEIPAPLRPLMGEHASGMKRTGSKEAPQTKAQPVPARFPTPPGTKWGDITMELVDGNTVSIRVEGGKGGKYNHAELGMKDDRNANPTKAWKLLREFAKGDGFLVADSWEPRRRDGHANQIDEAEMSSAVSRRASAKAQHETQRKQVGTLASRLRGFFGINDSPFLWVEVSEDGAGWRAEFSLQG